MGASETDDQAGDDAATSDTGIVSSARVMTLGIDGSPGSTKALHWAARRTERFGPIQPVAVWHHPWWSYGSMAPGAPPRPPDSAFAGWAEAEATRVLSDVSIEKCLPVVVTKGRAGPTLVELGEKGRLIVVGTRGRGALLDTMLGSVSEYCVSHARVPIAVIPSHAALDDPFERVVVGVDGSANSIQALRWALTNTAASVQIEAVQAWGFVPSTIPEVSTIGTENERLQAVESLDLAISEALSQVSDIDASRLVRTTVVMGDARDVLERQSVGADMLVIGSVGRGPIQRLLVGSVATAMCHQPALPTVVVPAANRVGQNSGVGVRS